MEIVEGRMSRLEERLAGIEAVLPHLATKEDIADVKRIIIEREAVMLKWLIGITMTAAVGLFTALARLFLPV